MSGTLPTWLEQLLEIPPSGSGEGTSWQIDWTPLWGSWLHWITLAFVAFSVAWVVYFYFKEVSSAGPAYRLLLAGLRLSLILLVALVLMADLLVLFQRTELPYAVVIVDQSASMGIADVYDDEQLRAEVERRLRAAGEDQPTRLALARTLLLENNAALLDEIERHYKLKLYFVASSARNQPGEKDELVSSLANVQADGQTSRLGEGVRTVLSDLRGTPPAAIVLLTDGITTEGPTLDEAGAYARRKNVPLLIVGLGSDQPQRNLRLGDLLADEVVFANDVVKFEATLDAAGLSGRSVDLVLRDRESDTELSRRTIVVPPDGRPEKVTITHRFPRIGEFEVVLEVEQLPEEIQQADNRLTHAISVRKEQIRVLLVQAYPNYEFRYLKHMLERDNTIELATVLQEADLEYSSEDRTARQVFPVSRDELFSYDTLIFGDVDPAFLSPTVMQNIADFVLLKGGGLIFIAGGQYTPLRYGSTPLADLFPVELNHVRPPTPGQLHSEGFVVRPTDLGLASPALQLGDSRAENAQLWAGLPPLYWMLEAPSLKPGARVLAEHPTRLGSDGPLPLVVMHYVGAGKVLMHTTDETWRWRKRVGDVYFARYWVQTIRYLSRSKLLGNDRTVELSADPSQARSGESVRLRARFFDERQAPTADDGVSVILQREGQPNRRLTLARSATSRGVFEGVLTRPAAGAYHAWVAEPALQGKAPSVDILVEAPPGETQRTQMDSGALSRVATLTGGKFYKFHQAASLADDLPRGRLIPMDPLPPISIWDRRWLLWSLLGLFLTLLVAEWLLRKRRGML